jgi:hypothetical protein
MFQVCRKFCRMSSVAAVTVAAVAPEDAVDHGADNGNTIAGASTITVAITGTAVVDRGVIIDLFATVVAAPAAAVIAATAGSDDNTAATGVASGSISATGGAGHRASAATTSGKGLSAAAAMPGKGLAAATMTIILMAGSQRIRCHRYATQRDCGCESDESFFVKHVILLCFKQKSVCDCNDNAGPPPKVAGHKDTFACQTAMRFALIASLNDESRDSLQVVGRKGSCRREAFQCSMPFVDKKVLRLPEAGGLRGQPERVWISA